MTTRAAQYDRYGGPEVLSIRDVADPVPRAGRAIVRMEATSVNHVDAGVREGSLRIATGWWFPKGTGLDVLGTVESVGAGWTGPPVGTRVWGFKPNLPTGRLLAAAQRYEVRSGWVAAAPDGPSELGSLPLVASAALIGLTQTRLRSGQRALIRGAAGGVGAAAVQLAKALGAHVTALGGADDLDYLTSLGADDALDYRTATPATIGKTFDVILDVVGTDLFAWRRRLAPGGRMTTTATSGTAAIVASVVFGPRRIQAVIAAPKPADLERLARWVADGALTPQVGATFALDAIVEAHRALADTRGKVLVTID